MSPKIENTVKQHTFSCSLMPEKNKNKNVFTITSIVYSHGSYDYICSTRFVLNFKFQSYLHLVWQAVLVYLFQSLQEVGVSQQCLGHTPLWLLLQQDTYGSHYCHHQERGLGVHSDLRNGRLVQGVQSLCSHEQGWDDRGQVSLTFL